MTRTSLLAAVWLLIFCAPAALRAELLLDVAAAQVPVREDRVVFVPRVAQTPTLDGRLNEAFWRQAGVIEQWVDRASNEPADAPAALRLVAGPEALYLGVTLREAAGLSFKEPKGGDEYGGSLLEIFLDPNGKHRTKVQIVTNPLGLRYDAFDYRTKEWTGAWQSVSKLENDVWTAEMAIPYSDLNIANNRPFWAANFGFVLLDQGRMQERAFSWTGGWGDPSQDYGVLYFGDKAQYEQSLRPKLSLYLDRQVYDVRDASGKALLRIASAGALIDQMSLQVKVRQQDRVVAQQVIRPLPADDLALTLDLQSLPLGEYTLDVELVNSGQAVAAVQQSFSRRDRQVHPPAQPAGRVPIRVHAQPRLTGVTWGISTGVPFAPGSLTDPDRVRLLDPAGREVPCQVSVRSTWSPRGPIQWLGVDFIPTLSDQAQLYTLEYGPEVRRQAAPEQPLRIDESPDAFTLDTGAARFTIHRRQFNLLAAAAVGGREVLDGGGGGLSLVDHEGNRYRADLDRDVQVTLEDQGTLRATLCAKGWYVREGSDGSVTHPELPTDRLCLFTVRLTAYAGSPILRAAVSTTVTYDTTKVRLRELTIALPVGTGRTVNVGDVAIQNQGYLLQDRWDRATDSADRQHPSSEGWVQAGDLAIAMRRFSQLFPKEIGYADGLLTLHPWPRHGRDTFPIEEQLDLRNIYKLRYAHQGRELDFTFPEPYFKTLDDYYAATPSAGSPYYKEMRSANAQGLTIHNDLLIAAGDVEGATLARLVNVDPHAAADPAYLCATGVFGPMLHADEDFADFERTLATGYQHLTTRTTTQGGEDFGMFIFGNLHNHWNYNHNAGELHRVWSNGHYHIARIPFIQYARTGDPMWMDWGRDHANTLRDIAMVHYVSPQRRFPYHQLGAAYHCKGFAPWGGDAHVAAHPICKDFLIYDFMLFGNRRGLDALNDWIAGVKEANPGGFATREGMTTMAELLEAYRFTWDPALLEIMANFRTQILREPFEKSGSWDFHTLLLTRDWSLVGDDRMLSTFRAAVDANPRGNSHFGTVHHQGFFALLDNDPQRVKNFAGLVFNEAQTVLRRPGQFGDGMNTFIWIQYAYQAHKFPYLLKAMKQFGIQPQRTQTAEGSPLPASGRTARLVVRETADQPFTLTLTPSTRPGSDMPVRVLRDGQVQIATGTIPAVPDKQAIEPTRIEVPADGVASQYVVVIDNYDVYSAVAWPVSNLPHEVAVALPGQPLDLVTERPPTSEGMLLSMIPRPQGDRMIVTSRNKNPSAVELLDGSGASLARASASRYVQARDTMAVPASNADAMRVYVTSEILLKWESASPLILAPSADRLFSPSPALLAPQP